MSTPVKKLLLGSGADTKHKAMELLKIFKRGTQFTEELMRENERLRFRLLKMDSENRLLAKQVMASKSFAELLKKMQQMEEERSELLHRFQVVEIENKDYKSRHHEIEYENNRLANLYIATFQIHSTLDVKEVLRISVEILINLVGTLDFAFLLRRENKLVPILIEGKSVKHIPSVELGRGMIGEAGLNGEVVIFEKPRSQRPDWSRPRVCIPLVVENRVLGMFVIFSFLPQKGEITELDHELFRLLAGHAAMALYAARLHAGRGSVADNDGMAYFELLK